MKSKKGEVIFCVGLITVLINAISSELLTSTDALHYIPAYTSNNGKLLMSTIINPDYTFKLVYYVDKSGDEIQRIRFESLSFRRENPALNSEVWGGIPGIQAHARELGDPLGQYCFEGFHINLRPVSGTPHSLMRFRLKFNDRNQQKTLVVEMMIIAKPTTQEGRRIAEDYDVYNCNDFTSFEELMTRLTSRQLVVNLEDDFPWIEDVLDRAKFLGITGHEDIVEWYYAGAIMVNRAKFDGILRLDPLWESHIRN